MVRGDPVEDLRTGWDPHVGFGLANPALHSLIDGEARSVASAPAAVAAAEVLAGQIRRIAEADRLRVGEERVAHLVYAAGCGTMPTPWPYPGTAATHHCPTWPAR